MLAQRLRRRPNTKDIYDDFKLKKTFGLHGLYKTMG